jgi:hypothetical protein
MGRRQIIQDFGSVVLDSCASGFPSSTSRRQVIYISDVGAGRDAEDHAGKLQLAVPQD